MAKSALLTAFERHWDASGLSASTIENYLQVYERMQRRGFALPTELSIDDARRYVSSRLREVKASSVAFEVKAIRSLSKWASGYLDQPDALVYLKIPKFDAPAAQPTATADDVAKLLLACKNSIGFESVRDCALISFFAATGARRSEVARMKVTDIDLDRGVATLLATKARVPRVVSIEAITPAIQRYFVFRDRHPSRTEEALWLGQKGQLGVQGIGFAVARREKQAGVKLGTHAFRRGMTEEWLRRNGRESTLQEVMGWTTGAMIRRYAKSSMAGLAVEEQRRLFPADEKRPGARAKPTTIKKKPPPAR